MSLVVTICYVCPVLYRFIFEFANHQSIQVYRSFRNFYILQQSVFHSVSYNPLVGHEINFVGQKQGLKNEMEE